MLLLFNFASTIIHDNLLYSIIYHIAEKIHTSCTLCKLCPSHMKRRLNQALDANVWTEVLCKVDQPSVWVKHCGNHGLKNRMAVSGCALT